MSEMIVWSSDNPIPECGASVQVIIRSRMKNGEVIEKMVRSFQVGEKISVAVAVPRNKKKEMARALASIERWKR